jgi:DNA-binding NarL/FixJ family response regulator
MPSQFSHFAADDHVLSDQLDIDHAAHAIGLPLVPGHRRGELSNQHPGHEQRMLAHSQRIRDGLKPRGEFSPEQEVLYLMERSGHAAEMLHRLRTNGRFRRTTAVLDSGTVAAIKRLRATGMTHKAIARELGIAAPQVAKGLALDPAAVAIRDQQGEQRQTRNARIVRLHAQGMRICDIASMLGMKHGTVTAIVHKYGGARRPVLKAG